MRAVFILGALLAAVAGLTCLCIIVPLSFTAGRALRKSSLPLFLFFAGIGFGFMLVEISQMQRLIVFLGHPTYGLSVVLFSLLASGGLGSYVTHRMGAHGTARTAIVCLFLLLCTLCVFGILTPRAVSLFRSSATWLRIVIAAAMLFPIGAFMGTAFPFGMRAASARAASLTPWLWGINGAASVCASVLAAVLSLSSGLSTTFWTGFSCYGVAFIAFVRASRGTGA